LTSTIISVITTMAKSLIVEGVIKQMVIITLKTSIKGLKAASKSSTNKIDDELVEYAEQILAVVLERWNGK